MTTDQFTSTVETTYGESYTQLGVPGVPFSAIRVPLADDPVEAAAWIDRALKAAAYLQRKFTETFPEPVQMPQNRPQQQNRPPLPQRPPRGQNRRPSGSGRQVDPGEPMDEGCNQCDAEAVYFMAGYHNNRSGKDVNPRIVCHSCKDGQYDHLVRWATDEDVALMEEAPF